MPVLSARACTPVSRRCADSEEWWLEQLAARNSTAIWLRSYYPHNYEITAVEAYMDLYQITGNAKYPRFLMTRTSWSHQSLSLHYRFSPCLITHHSSLITDHGSRP